MSTLRTFVCWLLLLALPLQGLAAGGPASCHDAAEMAGLAATAGAAASRSPCHEAAASVATAAEAPPEATACSVCAACCMAAVPGVPALPFRPGSPAQLLPMVAEPAPTSVGTLPLERPPRGARP